LALPLVLAAVVWGVLPPVGAVLVGAVVGTLWGTPAWAPRAGGQLLRLGIVASGAGLQLGVVAAAGAEGFVGAAAVLGVAGAVGYALARRWRVDAEVAALVTAGTAICGGSAIAAVGPALGARAANVAAALGVVFLLNAIALVAFPLLGSGMDDAAYARFCALGIHDTSSVVGAAGARGADVLAHATVLKLARSLWIVPVVLALGYWGRKRGSAHVAWPWFILGFVAVSALVTAVPTLQPVGEGVARAGRWSMTVALWCVGMGLTPRALRAVGLRPLAMGVALWAVVVPVSAWVALS